MTEKKRPDHVSFAIAALRRASYRWWAMSEAMTRARQSRGVYVCAKCFGLFGRREVQRDHIMPIVPVTGWDGFTGFIDRLFCQPEDIQIICRPCHKAKTKAENAERRLNKKAEESA